MTKSRFKCRECDVTETKFGKGKRKTTLSKAGNEQNNLVGMQNQKGKKGCIHRGALLTRKRLNIHEHLASKSRPGAGKGSKNKINKNTFLFKAICNNKLLTSIQGYH